VPARLQTLMSKALFRLPPAAVGIEGMSSAEGRCVQARGRGVCSELWGAPARAAGVYMLKEEGMLNQNLTGRAVRPGATRPRRSVQRRYVSGGNGDSREARRP